MAHQRSVSETIVERRLALRVPVKGPVRVYDGSHRIPAEFIDLSLTGCRVLCREPLTADRHLWVFLPAALGEHFALPLRGEVMWADSVPSELTGVCEVAVRCVSGSSRRRQRHRPLLAAPSDRRRLRPPGPG